MKKLPLFCSLAALAAALAALILVLLPRPAQSADAAESYRLEKLNQITDMVLERQVVPADYLRYVDEELAQAVEEYNSATQLLKMNYSIWAEGVVESVLYDFGDAPEPPDPYDRPERYYQMVDRLSTLAFYPNSTDFIFTDPVLSFSAAHESGGSYGLWAIYLHEDWYVEEDLARQASDYFTQVDTLLDQLDAARAAF